MHEEGKVEHDHEIFCVFYFQPIYEEQDADSPDPKKPAFSYILQVAGCVFGPSLGSTKNEAKTRVSMEACESLGLENSGLKIKGKYCMLFNKLFQQVYFYCGI